MSKMPDQGKSASSSGGDSRANEATAARESTIDAAVEMTFPASDPPAWMPPGGARPAADVADGISARRAGSARSRVAGGPVSAAKQSSRPATSGERLGGRTTVGRRVRDEKDTPHDRPVGRGSLKREPLADQVPRPVKRTAGATAAPQTPANIRVDGVSLDDDDRAYIRRRLGEKLGKYAPSIERVTVRVRDVNGPRGGLDLLCRIKVVLSGLPSVVVEHRAATLRPALTSALTSAERAVRRTVQRSRLRPVRDVASEELAPDV